MEAHRVRCRAFACLTDTLQPARPPRRPLPGAVAASPSGGGGCPSSLVPFARFDHPRARVALHFADPVAVLAACGSPAPPASATPSVELRLRMPRGASYEMLLSDQVAATGGEPARVVRARALVDVAEELSGDSFACGASWFRAGVRDGETARRERVPPHARRRTAASPARRRSSAAKTRGRRSRASSTRCSARGRWCWARPRGSSSAPTGSRSASGSRRPFATGWTSCRGPRRAVDSWRASAPCEARWAARGRTSTRRSATVSAGPPTSRSTSKGASGGRRRSACSCARRAGEGRARRVRAVRLGARHGRDPRVDPAIQQCYEAQLRSAPTMAGRVLVRFRIDVDGHVRAVTHPEDTLHSPECARVWTTPSRAFASTRTAGPVTYAYPFVFAPRESSPPARSLADGLVQVASVRDGPGRRDVTASRRDDPRTRWSARVGSRKGRRRGRGAVERSSKRRMRRVRRSNDATAPSAARARRALHVGRNAQLDPSGATEARSGRCNTLRRDMRIECIAGAANAVLGESRIRAAADAGRDWTHRTYASAAAGTRMWGPPRAIAALKRSSRSPRKLHPLECARGSRPNAFRPVRPFSGRYWKKRLGQSRSSPRSSAALSAASTRRAGSGPPRAARARRGTRRAVAVDAVRSSARSWPRSTSSTGRGGRRARRPRSRRARPVTEPLRADGLPDERARRVVAPAEEAGPPRRAPILAHGEVERVAEARALRVEPPAGHPAPRRRARRIVRASRPFPRAASTIPSQESVVESRSLASSSASSAARV